MVRIGRKKEERESRVESTGWAMSRSRGWRLGESTRAAAGGQCESQVYHQSR